MTGATADEAPDLARPQSPTGSTRWSSRRRRHGAPRLQALAGTDTALGIIPAGTGNDVARYLDLPRKDPQRGRRRGRRRHAPARIDLARIGVAATS